MRNFINEVEQKLEGGFDFAASLKTMLGIEDNEVEEIIEKLSVDELSDLIDACLKKNKQVAREIIDNLNVDEKEIPRKKSRKHHHKEEEIEEEVSRNIGDPVSVNGKEATIKYPQAPNDTVGVLIDGELQMAKSKDVKKVKEAILGMSPLPGLNGMQDDSQNDDIRRMKELAGVRDEVPAEMPGQPPMVPPSMEAHPDERLPFHNMDFDNYEEDEGNFDTFGDDYHEPVSAETPTIPIPMPSETIGAEEGDYASIEGAITEIEDMIPNIKISEYKALVARLKALLSMAEGAGRSALAEAAKKKGRRLREGFENGVWVEPNGGGDNSDEVEYVVVGKTPKNKYYRLGTVESSDADLSKFSPKSKDDKVVIMSRSNNGKFSLVKNVDESDRLQRSGKFKVGQRIEAGKKGTEDYDTGRVTKVEGDQITVAWDSGSKTTQPSRALKVDSESRKDAANAVKKLEPKKEDRILPKDAPKKDKPRSDEPTGTRKTLMDYVFEADDDGMQTIGANRNDAIKALKMRMGPNISDQQASAAFDGMMKAGTVKQDGPAFKMPTMSDDALKTSMAPNTNTPNNSGMSNGPTNLGTDMNQINQGPIQTIKPR
jgi:hypothetical protein